MFTVVLLCTACFAYWCWCHQRAKTAEPPPLPGAWPLVGHLPLFFGDGCKIWNQMTNAIDQGYDVGGTAKINLGPITVYGVADPDDCNTIATTCLEKDLVYDLSKPWFGESLFTSRYEVWKNDYKLLNPAFSQTILNTFMDVFNSESRKLVKEFDKHAGKDPFDHFTYLRHNALNIICMTALGVGFTDSNLASDYLHAADSILNTMLERFIKFWWYSPYTFAWSKLKNKQDAYLKVLHKMSDAVLQKRKSELFGNTCVEINITPGTKFKPFVDILLELSIEKGAFNDEQIRAQVDFMLAAGHETTPNALLYTMVLLGSHPDVQEKVFSEIQEVLGGNKDVEKMDLSRLQYLEAVVKESLRLFTVVPQIARKLEKDVKLSKTYAMMSMKTTLAHVVRSYRIKADHTKMRLKYVATLKPDNDGHYISIEKRT
ncbi:hypothetical protein PYW07_009844 [Mythimna separata]|uniref:Cytochrome P450 n=1 Tax=Mythimna separata TaxID=271217 RepID=A0AAD7YGV9_MYTSE|nr:hypothetical protein PYW07_009844 [Mythimna separata]